MAQHLERHPKMHATINLVPSLIKQIEEYLSGEAVDPVVALMTKPAASLTTAEQDFMLEHFFRANEQTMIGKSERYRELYAKAFEPTTPQPPIESRASSSKGGGAGFFEQDYRDLAVHYSLAWTGAIARQSEPFKSLIAKDRGFTEDDKQQLHTAQLRNVREIFPLHRKLAKRGQIELTTTPFYHPIMPLLIDTNVALESMPNATLPATRFEAPEEADEQMRRAHAFFKSHIGMNPSGVWPSEGSVSQDTLALIRKNGFTWTATDEGVLKNSIEDETFKVAGQTIKPEHAKYFPWRGKTSEGPLTIFFRDHRLSDDIGFTYQSWNAKEAVAHFIGNLHEIRLSLVQEYGEKILDDACVSVILDGENCWEYYQNNGFDFLDTLYTELVADKQIATLTFSEAIEASSAKHLPILPRVVAGSWINSNFRIWIGHDEDNAAWDALGRAKESFDQVKLRATKMRGAAKKEGLARIELAHEELMIAEGSDWCWWYGDDHANAQKDIFDELFRMHLRAMYVHLDLTVPPDLLRGIPSRGELIVSSATPTTKYGSMHKSDD